MIILPFDGRKGLFQRNIIAGTVEVSNGSRDIYDQTVIIVAVNEIGKAFALGYQHFDLSPQSQQFIPYSSSLPGTGITWSTSTRLPKSLHDISSAAPDCKRSKPSR